MKEAIKSLIGTGSEAIIAFSKRDLLREEVNIEKLWTLPQVQKLLKKQQPNGLLWSQGSSQQYFLYRMREDVDICSRIGSHKEMLEFGVKIYPSLFFSVCLFPLSLSSLVLSKLSTLLSHSVDT